MKVLPSFCASQTGTRREPDRDGVSEPEGRSLVALALAQEPLNSVPPAH